MGYVVKDIGKWNRDWNIESIFGIEDSDGKYATLLQETLKNSDIVGPSELRYAMRVATFHFITEHLVTLPSFWPKLAIYVLPRLFSTVTHLSLWVIIWSWLWIKLFYHLSEALNPDQVKMVLRFVFQLFTIVPLMSRDTRNLDTFSQLYNSTSIFSIY